MTVSMIAEDGFVLFQPNDQIPHADGLYFYPGASSFYSQNSFSVWYPIVFIPYGTQQVHCAYCGGGVALSSIPHLSACRAHHTNDPIHLYYTVVHRVHPAQWNEIRRHLGPLSPHLYTFAYEGSFYNLKEGSYSVKYEDGPWSFKGNEINGYFRDELRGYLQNNALDISKIDLTGLIC